MDDYRLEALEAENERLRDKIYMLEEGLGIHELLPAEWCLTGKEAAVLGHLIKRDIGTKRSIMTALYASGGIDEPEMKIVDVFVCKLRKKMATLDVTIETRWGEGYFLTPEMKTKIKQLTGDQQ